MNKRYRLSSVAGVACLLWLALSVMASAQVSQEDFQKLQAQVALLSQQVQTLQQTNNAYQQKIQSLQQQVGSTKEIAKSAEEKASTAEEKMNEPVDLSAQMASAASHNFVLAGDAEVTFGRTAGFNSGSFMMADFAPIFLYRANDNILFEAGFDFILQNGQTTLLNGQNADYANNTTVNLSFATIDYIVNNYVTLVAGEMLLPLGTYSERSAGWINPIPDSPLPVAVLPQTGVGAELKGAIPLNQYGRAITYSGYIANGPSSVDGTGKSTYTDSTGAVLPNLDLGGNVGLSSSGNQQNLNGSASGGARIAFFNAFKPHYDIEVGLSGQTGPYTTSNQYYSAAVIDASMHLSPYFMLQGEYINTWVQTTDIGTYQAGGFWLQGTYKLAAFNSDLTFINNLELVSRFDTVNDGLGTKTDRFTAGYIYHFSNTLMFENDYEWLNNSGPNPLPNSAYVFQLSYGF
jgi:cell division protein FtsB